MYEIDPQRDLPLAREFMAAPIGLHSPNLQRLVRGMRSGPVKGKYVLLCTTPGHEWTLMRMSGERGVPPQVLEDTVFDDLLDAERAVFKLRWKQSTGRELVLDEE